MQILCSDGYLISSEDQKVLNYYLIQEDTSQTPQEWGQNALNGMINKAIKSILKDYLDLYISQQTGNIDTTYSVLLPLIIEMPQFIPYNIETSQTEIIDRTNSPTIQVWEGGFSVEDWQKQVLDAYYSDIEGLLDWSMTNKIYQRRKEFCNYFRNLYITDQVSFPANEDAFIDFVTIT